MNGDAAGFNGTQIVSRSTQLNQPIIYVSLNYRVNAFGFLGGSDVGHAGTGNIGLHDRELIFPHTTA
jgi:Carboxylesterase type B